MGNTLTVLVENNPGVLARVAGMFSRRGYNIDSLSVSTTDDPRISRMTIIVQGDEAVLQQVTRQLRKLVDVIKVQDITRDPHVDRELSLIKVTADTTVRGEIMQIVEIFRARIVDVSQDSLIIEVTGDEGKVNAIEEALKPFGIREMVRTGTIALLRGSVTAAEYEED
ncbi:MAG: acetolactate synthase small subunit [Desulforudis sp.]|nr:acetolactate synthase small subunit [Clostridia bacterium]MDQ7792133.1 acetolactate synthase small subunit [Clostridia bacterium]RJX18322.1 MAG: acetolactate synthase small subunit [Desulforudis sp.]